MYQISRSIYRELEAEIIEGRQWADGPSNHERVLRACEAAVQRLATDRHYFARPSRTLFNDIRAYFPMSAQLHVYRVVDRYLSFAGEYLASRPTAGDGAHGPASSSAARRRARARRASACRCRATATARRTSTWPRPKRCSSRVARRRRRERTRSRRAEPMLPRRRRRRDVHRRRRRRRRAAGHGEGADDAATTSPRACSPRSAPRWSAPERGASDVQRVRARDDRRDERAARGPRRAHRAGRDRGLRGRRRARPPGARRPLPAVRRAPGAARAARAPRRRARADGARRRRCARSRTRRALAGARRARSSPRRSRSACCTPTATRRTSRRSAPRCASALPDVHVSLSHEVVGTFREYERAATTEIDAALSPLLAAYLAALAGRAPARACRRPTSCSPRGGLATLEQAPRATPR